MGSVISPSLFVVNTACRVRQDLAVLDLRKSIRHRNIVMKIKISDFVSISQIFNRHKMI